MQPFPIAILGVGPAGANYLRQCKTDFRIQVVGFTNRSEPRRRAVAEQTGVPGFATLAELLAGVDPRPRMVVIATANPTHRDFAIEAMQAGLDVFCEKPMAMSLADCQQMLDCEAATGRVLQIGFEYRYGTMTARLKELQEQGAIGELRCIDILDSRGHWWPETPDTPLEEVWRLNPERGGGPIIHCGIHELDLLRSYGGEIQCAQAFVAPTSLPFYPRHAPDHVCLQFRFASGATGSFTLYHNIAGTWYRSIPRRDPHYPAVPGHDLNITMTGSGGALVAELYKERLHVNRYDAELHETVYLRTETFGHHPTDNTHHNTPQMIIDFAMRLRAGAGALHSAADSLQTTRLGLICEELVQEAIADGWTSQRRDL